MNICRIENHERGKTNPILSSGQNFGESLLISPKKQHKNVIPDPWRRRGVEVKAREKKILEIYSVEYNYLHTSYFHIGFNLLGVESMSMLSWAKLHPQSGSRFFKCTQFYQQKKRKKKNKKKICQLRSVARRATLLSLSYPENK